ncbi:nuclear pore complex protein NUP1 [Euphorbia lathyris]|uniref:nuclear pore complex protein NUP1 n=1 Tax=Euphorbia lathyris TaxID=212925 RepID=UPI003313E3E9
MAAARERNDNPYEDGGGFGKFRKRPSRKVHSTPYDRPPTAVRNPIIAATTNGWLSKLVDPAQRLITSGAHKLFASVFRKRLPPPPPPQPPETGANVGASNSQQEEVLIDSSGIQESAVNKIDYPASSSDTGGLTELELILKQKTFTKSEIGRLTALLHSRNVDLSLGNQEQNFEVIPSKPVLPPKRKEVQVRPVKDNGPDRYDISTPIASPSVLDEDVATPAELAKAYMGSRPSKVSPPVLGFRSRAVEEDSIAQINRPLPLKSPILSVVPRSSVRGVSMENGFVTPRSRGRSAIYNMARTPYSRLHSTSTLQGTGSEIDVFGAPSSSQSMWENGRFSASKQGALKRRSSVFDNDIGSVGPIRRIRQKSNLLPSSGIRSIRGITIASDAAKHPSSSQKEASRRETLTENVDNMTHRSGTSSVPSKSSEVASQILQQLDVLVPSRDKSPSKLSPSMLRGQALRSLDNVESSKFLETVQDNKLDAKHGGSLPDTQKSVFQKEDKIQGNGTAKPLATYTKSASSLNGVEPTNLLKKKASDVKSTYAPGFNNVVQTSPQKKRAFQMSAHEDFLELDDDDHADKTPSATLSTEKEKVVGSVAQNKASSADASVLVKAAAFPEGKNQLISMLNQKSPGASDRFTIPDKNTAFTVAAASLSGVSSQQTVVENQAALTSMKTSPPKEPNAPIFSFEKKAVSPKEPNGFPSTFDFNSKASVPVSTLPLVTGPMATTFGITSDNKSNNSSSLGFNAFNATKPMSEEPESDKADVRNNFKAGVFFSSAETVSSGVSTSSPSTTSVFLFSGTPSKTSVMNGAIPTPSASFADKALVPNFISSQSSIGGAADAVVRSDSNAITTTTANNNDSSNLSISTSTPSSVSGSVFKFVSTVVPSASTLSTSATTGVELTESKMKQTSFDNLISAPFGSALSPISSTGGSIFSSTSSAIKSTGSSIFDGTSAVASSSNSFGISASVATTAGNGIFSFNAGGITPAVSTQSQGFNPFGAASAQASSAVSVFATSSESIPIKFGTSASAPSFGLTANTAVSSGSSLFSSSTSTDKLFSAGGTPAANPVVSTTSSPPVGFGSSSFLTPNFASAFSSSSSSTGFAFAASSASGAATASTSTTPMMFGTSASVFNFSSPATATPSQPAFSSTPSSPYGFGLSAGNNDQMNMEDSMAEDTVQATTSTVPVFGQQPVTPPSFVFGSTTPAGGNQFASTGASGVNPFQFGGQQNVAAPQNQSPFQASGSLEFNAGESFSLGTGGGDKSSRKFVRVSRKNPRKK